MGLISTLPAFTHKSPILYLVAFTRGTTQPYVKAALYQLPSHALHIWMARRQRQRPGSAMEAPKLKEETFVTKRCFHGARAQMWDARAACGLLTRRTLTSHPPHSNPPVTVQRERVTTVPSLRPRSPPLTPTVFVSAPPPKPTCTNLSACAWGLAGTPSPLFLPHTPRHPDCGLSLKCERGSSDVCACWRLTPEALVRAS